jgi:hypothetical protein
MILTCRGFEPVISSVQFHRLIHSATTGIHVIDNVKLFPNDLQITFELMMNLYKQSPTILNIKVPVKQRTIKRTVQ